MVAFRHYIASEVAAFHRVRDRFGPFSNMASGFPIEQNSPQPPSFREGSRRLPFLRRHFLLRIKEAGYIFASCTA